MDTAATTRVNTSVGHLSALQRHFEISLYFLILTGVLCLVSTGKMDLVTILLMPVALLFKGYRWWHEKGPEITNQMANRLTIVYFVFFPLDLMVFSRLLAKGAQSPSLYAALLAAIHLMLFALLVRLYSASTIRDYLFLTMMAFAAILGSAILTVDTTFLAFFVLFFALAVSTFVALEMWKSAQDSITPPIESGTPPARRLHSALGVTAAGIAIGSMVVGAVIFLILPRFNGGYMSGFSLQPTLVSGFTNDVELGEIGEIKKSSVVVMRIKVDGGLNKAHGLHWRGVALTDFDGKRWFNPPKESLMITPTGNGWFHLISGKPEPNADATPIHYTVLLEPIASTALFFANEAETVHGNFNAEGGGTSFSQRRSYLLQDSAGSIFNPYHNYARMEYEATSMLPSPKPGAVRHAGVDYPKPVRDLYLQMPKLDPRIPELARQITARNNTPYDKVQQLELYLRTHYAYTLDLTGLPGSDPLSYFLFQKRAGHCEYFAAAMTMMVRSLGIPARYVNGFLTGEYNDVGGDFVVRASDAHSWVEVYFPSFGWLTFDPTPPADDLPLSWYARLGHYWDWFELQWSEWVINYDFLRQFTLAQNVSRVSRDWTERARISFALARRRSVDILERWQFHLVRTRGLLPGLIVTMALATVALVAFQPQVRKRLTALWHLRLASAKEMTPHLATIQYNEMLRLLARRGFRKAPAQTPAEFASSLPDLPLARPVQELTAVYQASRFGGKAADARHASSLLVQIQASLRASG